MEGKSCIRHVRLFSTSIFYIYSFIFRLHVLYLERKMAKVLFFFFFQTHFANLHFVHFVTRPLHFLTLRRYISLRGYWLERSSLLKICTVILQMTVSQSFGVPKYFNQKLLPKKNWKRRKFRWIWLTSVLRERCLYYRNRCGINFVWCPTSLKKFRTFMVEFWKKIL